MTVTVTSSRWAHGGIRRRLASCQFINATQQYAVRSLSDGSSFQYDANGNMLIRMLRTRRRRQPVRTDTPSGTTIYVGKTFEYNTGLGITTTCYFLSQCHACRAGLLKLSPR